MPNALRPASRVRVFITLLSLSFAVLIAYQFYFATRVQAVSTSVVISQIYGGGGNTGAQYQNDFVELFNRGNTTISLSGWSVGYASATGTGNFATAPISGSIAPGQYYLVKLGPASAVGAPLPTPDTNGPTGINMSGTAGKVVVATTTTLACNGGSTPCSAAQLAQIVDLVGYGGANFFEGAPAPALSNTTAGFRDDRGCTDTDNNSADFASASAPISPGAPSPRNTASALNPCTTNQPIAPSCPVSLNTTQGTAASAGVSATDPDGTVTNANITSTPVPGITLDNFVAAPSNNTAATATLNVANTTAVGNYNVTIQYSNNDSPTPQTATCTVAVNVTAGPTNPTGTGSANPSSVLPGESSTLTVTVTPGGNPTSTGITVTVDLSPIGGSATQTFYDDGSNGDLISGNNVFTYHATVALGTTAGAKSLPFTISDAESRLGNGTIALTVQEPPPPVDHIVISQIYGGGGNTGATFRNDYVELYNPTGVSFNLAGWTLQYGSATGTTWTNNQPLGGIIAPGEYYLVGLGSGGAAGSLLPAPNISGSINMSATNGKIVLVNNSSPLSGACPIGTDPDIVDFVGYGTTANCFEGAGRAPAGSNTTALFRKVNGAQDTNQNSADFAAGAPNPRRTSSIQEIGPWVAFTDPNTNDTNVPFDATMSITFSEAMDVVDTWYDINCSVTGAHNSATVASTNGFKTYAVTPNTSFRFGEQCTVTIFKEQVHDQDLDDSTAGTDSLPENYTWSFTVVAAGDAAPYLPDVHLTMGNPSNAMPFVTEPNNYLMEKPGFALSYSRDKGTPNWVSWHLDTSWFGTLARVDTFRPDPAVPADWYRVQAFDYSGSGFDRGHNTPNADRDHQNRIPINQETFLMTNMIPQAPDQNQGPWANMENYLRTLLTTPAPEKEIYVVMGGHGVGGTGDNGFKTTIANGYVTVPNATWRVMLVIPKGDDDVSRVSCESRTIAVIMPNSNTHNGTTIRDDNWQDFIVSVDQVEGLTGYDFFANLPDAVENCIEAGNNGVNKPGTANQSATTPEDTAVEITLEAVRPSNATPLTFSVVTGPTNGSLGSIGATSCVDLECSATVTYTPGTNYNGADSFTFKVNDGTQDSNTSTVTITVNSVNDDPDAVDDEATIAEDSGANTISVLANDSDGDGGTLAVTAITQGTNGSVAITNGGADVSYTPNANFFGNDTFAYTISDGQGGSDTATVRITVNNVQDAPDAVDDSATVAEDSGANTINVRVNDTDVDGDTLTVTAVTQGTNGSVIITNGGADVSYTPNANFFGNDSFTYTVSDGNGGSDTATVNITVTNVNDAPVLTSSVTMSLISSTNSNLFNVGLTANATDQEGETVTIQVAVFGDEDDETATLPGVTHSPDAKDIAPDTLRLRGERVEANDGRVYLIVVTATDASGGIDRNYHTVVVPRNNKPTNVNAVVAEAAAAAAFAEANGGTPPPGYFVIGDGLIIGPKQ